MRGVPRFSGGVARKQRSGRIAMCCAEGFGGWLESKEVDGL